MEALSLSNAIQDPIAVLLLILGLFDLYLFAAKTRWAWFLATFTSLGWAWISFRTGVGPKIVFDLVSAAYCWYSFRRWE